MSDKTTDGQVLTSETVETPNPQFSQEPQSESSPGDSDAQLDALVEKLTPRLQETFERMSQSQKDKGIASAKKDASEAKAQVDSLRATVERFDNYLKRYGDRDRALEEMERDDKIEKILSGQPATGLTSSGKDNRPWGVKQKEILDSVGVDLTDRRVVELAKSKTWSDPDEYLAELSKASFSWVQSDLSKPTPDISTVANPTRSHTSSSSMAGSTEELGNRMIELQKDYTKNKEQIMAIEAEILRREKEGN